MKRFLLFFATNILVVLTISALVNILGLRPELSARGINYQSLLIFCAVWGFAGSFISLQLSRWMAKQAMGVHVFDPNNPPDAMTGKLAATVKDLCRRSGLETLPEIGIYESREVNAFATGPSRSRSLLAVSTGLLDSMDARAVEGVLGHEISHIANGDMVTMTLLQGVANTFVMFFARVIAFMIDNALRSRDDDRRGGGLGYMGHYLVVMLLESVLMLLASVVVYWFSRRREYAADAGSAKLTGRETMIHALEQLERSTGRRDDRAPALSTFKINGHGRGLAAMLFSSHPPIALRIEALRRS
jgi:heat shock protein HtpX